ncbi:hypothetical protein OE88DRAFT_1209232 [Heliocybe sulcata]|uniref:Uncharacterized protein n=1 Tax=Heliocybe sulcata TaxID=5364 RepID=A0A5C3NA59_9AGAM|nr:hypothetical protein OE88DRAFT_1209232 [Heliocybe sulcata]
MRWDETLPDELRALELIRQSSTGDLHSQALNRTSECVAEEDPKARNVGGCLLPRLVPFRGSKDIGSMRGCYQGKW